ncbi:zinc-binding dehydrogenase [Nocardia paucivorans]|uniref:zinc-binding dehydrogenase n=1 Tax=Nocardia paucivorans TaxID=114259 RepID=UPI0002FA23EF|nr:zinc-binding dehydrogenase [Nocardia paucivorans]
MIAAVRGAAKLKLAGRLGADAVIDYSQNDWTEQVPAATGGSGPRLMFDGAGGALGSAAPAVTADGGRFIGYGAAGGDFATTTGVDRNVEVVTLFDLQADAAEQYRRGVHVQADRAHAAIETRTAIGRTVLTV